MKPDLNLIVTRSNVYPLTGISQYFTFLFHCKTYLQKTCLCFLCLSVLILTCFSSKAQSGITIVVNHPGDSADFNEFDGVCDADPIQPGGQCTFRAAIQNHNNNRQLDQNRINFEIANAPGTGSIVIKVGSTGLGALPSILGAVTISGSNKGDLRRIELDGSMAGSDAIGLNLLGEHCDISFFIINSFSSHGIHMSGTQFSNGGHKIYLNFIGTDSTTMIDKGNGGDGIFIEDVPNNMIGGDGILDGNTISGNGGYGVHILGRNPDSTGFPLSGGPGNKVFHNSIGFDRFGDIVIPNDKGGVFINNAKELQVGEGEAAVIPANENKGNKIGGQNNGITVSGSLSKGIRIEGNTIGKDGTTAKFLVGIFARPGELFTASGNFITNVDGVGIDLFIDANGFYNLKKNEIEGKAKIGALIKFAENRTVNIEYRNNIHNGNEMGFEMEESINGTINWVIDSNRAVNGTHGGVLRFKASGDKNLKGNNWNFNSHIGLQYFTEFSPGVTAKITVNGDAAIGNGLEGFFGKIQLEAQADITIALFNIVGSRNGKDGLAFGFGASAGAKGTFTIDGESEFEGNLGLAARLIGERTSIDVFRVEIRKSTASDNVEGAFYVFDLKMRFSIAENTIVNNGGPGIRMGGVSDVRIDSNTISGNTIGILAEETSFGSFSNNVITGNGKGIVTVSSVQGTLFFANSIFNNTGPGIDLNNDGITLNDEGDADTGPNNLQNFPVLTTASYNNGSLQVRGTLNSNPSTKFGLQFFSNDICNPSGFGEGQQFIGFDSVETDATGNVFFSFAFSVPVISTGSYITAIATDPESNSSEFSRCIQLGSVQQLADLELVKSVNDPQVNVGEQMIFTMSILNKGPGTATGIRVLDVMPAGFEINNIITTAGSYDTVSGIWSIASLTSGSTATLNIVITGTNAGSFLNKAEVISSDLPDPDSSPGNNVESEDDQQTISVEITAPANVQASFIQLINRVATLVSQGKISRQQGALFNVLLQTSLKLHQRGNNQASIATLKAFQILVNKLTVFRLLDKQIGKELYSSANEIISLLTVKTKPADTFMKANESVQKTTLYQNRPNPFSRSTDICFELARVEKVSLIIYDMNGRAITRLLYKVMPAGRHVINWTPENIKSGIYVIQLRTGSDKHIIKTVYIQ